MWHMDSAVNELMAENYGGITREWAQIDLMNLHMFCLWGVYIWYVIRPAVNHPENGCVLNHKQDIYNYKLWKVNWYVS